MGRAIGKCSYCNKALGSDVVYGDHDRRFCSESCATALLDREMGVGHHHVMTSSSATAPRGTNESARPSARRGGVIRH